MQQNNGSNLGARFWLTHAGLACILGLLIVIVPFGEWLLIPWLVFVAVFTFSERIRRRQGLAIGIHLLTTLLIILAAIVAPVKTTEQILKAKLVLPASKLTLAALDSQSSESTGTPWLPRYVHIASRHDNRQQVIQFASQELSLREFVMTIEQQSSLRHRFQHCGNGWSILFGGDCSFGLSLR